MKNSISDPMVAPATPQFLCWVMSIFLPGKIPITIVKIV